MKAAELGDFLAGYFRLLGDVGASRVPQVAPILAALSSSGAATVSAILKRVGEGAMATAVSPQAVSDDAAQALEALLILTARIAKPAAAKDLRALVDFLKQHPRIDWSAALLSKKAIGRRTSAKAAPSIRSDRVVAYADQLQANLHNGERFAAIFQALSNDDLTGAEFVALAKAFTNTGGRSKADALQRIWNRHARVMTGQAKGRATGGRSAA